MSRKSMDRRAFLRGAGGLLVALPVLESLACSSSSSQSETAGSQSQRLDVDKRLVMFFTPYGTAPDTFFPTGGTETNFTLTPQLAPLAAHQSDLLVLEGIDLVPFVKQGIDFVGHGAPFYYVMGGYPIFQGESTPGPGGMSLDQKIAQAIGQSSRLQSLPLDLGNSSQSPYGTISYTGANQPLPATRDPAAAFNKVFAGFNVAPSVVQAIHAERKSVLDFVLDDYTTLGNSVSGADKTLIDYHLQSIRDLETRLDNLASAQASCTVPTLNNPPQDPGTWQQGSGPDFYAIAEFHMELMALALACDITRVATLSWQAEMTFDGSLAGIEPNMAALQIDSHLASHSDWAKFGTIVTWYAARYAEMIQKLKDRNVFDKSLCVWFSENGAVRGNHSPYGIPYVLAGSAGGSFKTGRHVQCNGRPPNDLYVSIQNAFGITDTVFGDPGSCTGPITALNA